MVSVEEIILVIRSDMKTLTSDLKKALAPFDDLTASIEFLSKATGQSAIEAKAASNSLNDLVKSTKRSTGGHKKQKKSLQGLSSSLLSVLFFSSALSGALFGLLGPAAEATGIFELLSTTLLLLFLPVMEVILPFIIALLVTVAEMPKELKLVIGVFAIISAIILAVVAAIASLGLVILGLGGLTGLSTLFASLSASFVAMAPAIGVVLGALAALVAAITLVETEQDETAKKIGSTGGIAGIMFLVAKRASEWAMSMQDATADIEKDLDKLNNGAIKDTNKAVGELTDTVKESFTPLDFFIEQLTKIVAMFKRIAKGTSDNVKTLVSEGTSGFGSGEFNKSISASNKSETAAANILGLTPQTINTGPGPQDVIGAIERGAAQGLAELAGGGNRSPFSKGTISGGGSNIIQDFKDAASGARDTIVNIVNNITVSDPQELERAIERNNNSLLDRLFAQIGL